MRGAFVSLPLRTLVCYGVGENVQAAVDDAVAARQPVDVVSKKKPSAKGESFDLRYPEFLTARKGDNLRHEPFSPPVSRLTP